MQQRHVIVGAGLAGHRAAIQLRESDPNAVIHLFGRERVLPYDRPPLSKDFLLGRVSEAGITLRGAEAYAQLGIIHHVGRAVMSIDRAGQLAITEDGHEVRYDRLLLATGSRPRRLGCPVQPDVPVHYLREIGDALALRALLVRPGHVAVIGGGFIGLEVAAAACSLGARVTVLEAAPRLLSRAASPILSAYLLALHRARGVEVRLGAVVEGIAGSPEGGVVLRTGDGALDADAVLVGIGIEPEVGLAAAAGLEVEDGIVVDRSCRTSDPAIFAAGEVTAHPSGLGQRRRRVESWTVAAEQAIVAARAMTGETATYDDEPWFWSDQFGQNVQMLGESCPDCTTAIIGDPLSDRWTAIAATPEDRLMGVVAVNNGRHVVMARRAMRQAKAASALAAEMGGTT